MLWKGCPNKFGPTKMAGNNTKPACGSDFSRTFFIDAGALPAGAHTSKLAC